MAQEALRRVFDQVEDGLETLGAAVIRVRDLPHAAGVGKFNQQPQQLVGVFARATPGKRTQVQIKSTRTEMFASVIS
jgi:hypothetical protein